MSIQNLINGIAIVIDDEINDDEANIQKVIKQIEKQSIPLIKFEGIPSTDLISNFSRIGFIILDWKLSKKEMSEEENNGISLVKIPDNIEKYNIKANVNFIKQLQKVCFCPIFIFTNEVVTDVEKILITEKLYKKKAHNYIFIKSKSELFNKKSGTLFKEVEKWVKDTPSIYVLLEWLNSIYKAQNDLFWHFYEINSDWPRVLWKAYEDDCVDMADELGELISKNLFARMLPYKFDSLILDSKSTTTIQKQELRKVLEGERFLTKKYIEGKPVTTGDIFFINKKYYINIRPHCDCINRDSTEETLFYCLKGKKMSISEEQKNFDSKYNLFRERDNNCIIFSIHGGKTIEFLFKDLELKKQSELINDRIGRLLPPYITKIQQKYALYLQRQGLPITPRSAVFDEN